MRYASASQTSLLIAPITVAQDSTTTAQLDTRGFDYATLIVALSSEASTDAEGPTIRLLEDDTTVATNFATIVADQEAFDITAAGQLTYHVDMRGKKRYLRLEVTAGSHTTGDDITIAAVGILSCAEEAPAAVAGMVSGSNDVAVVV